MGWGFWTEPGLCIKDRWSFETKWARVYVSTPHANVAFVEASELKLEGIKPKLSASFRLTRRDSNWAADYKYFWIRRAGVKLSKNRTKISNRRQLAKTFGTFSETTHRKIFNRLAPLAENWAAAHPQAFIDIDFGALSRDLRQLKREVADFRNQVGSAIKFNVHELITVAAAGLRTASAKPLLCKLRKIEAKLDARLTNLTQVIEELQTLADLVRSARAGCATPKASATSNGGQFSAVNDREI